MWGGQSTQLLLRVGSLNREGQHPSFFTPLLHPPALRSLQPIPLSCKEHPQAKCCSLFLMVREPWELPRVTCWVQVSSLVQLGKGSLQMSKLSVKFLTPWDRALWLSSRLCYLSKALLALKWKSQDLNPRMPYAQTLNKWGPMPLAPQVSGKCS